MKKLTILLVFIPLLWSCKDDITFANENKIQIDTMAANRKRMIRAELDSICEMNQDTLVSKAVDSIFDARIRFYEQKLKDFQ